MSILDVNGANQSPTFGGFNGSVTIPEQRGQDLLLGRGYLHIHTEANSGGETRGYFVAQDAVPEPRSIVLIAAASLGLAWCRRRS